MKMELLEIGKPYIPGKTWPNGIMEYNFRGNQHEMRIFLNKLKNNEINSIKKDKIKFGLLVVDSVIFIIYKFMNYKKGQLNISFHGDMPFSVHLVPENMRSLPEIPKNENQRILLSIVLVESNTGLVQALREVSLSNDFSVELTTAIHEQHKKPFDQNRHDTIIKQVYKMYPDTDSMFDNAISTCRGGD